MSLRFAPGWVFTLLTALALPLFVGLGFWQWHRGEYRSEQWQHFAQGAAPAIAANADSLQRLPRFTHVRVEGLLDSERQFLLDNVSREGRPGYEVLSVLTLAEGSELLVNRGWLPFSGYRDRLPDVGFQVTAVQPLTGRLGALPTAGLAAGTQPPALQGPWPRLTSFPALQDLSAARGEKLLAPVLLLDADSGPGYVRSWEPPGISPQRNFSYAVQWWAFAALALALYIGLNLKRAQ